MKTTISRRFSFDAAHFLPNYEGKCSRLHGHSWQVEVGISGSIKPETGMIMDFTVLKKTMTPILEELDHHHLNEVEGLNNPTAELLCWWFASKLMGPIELASKGWARLETIKVWESRDSYAQIFVGS